MSAQANYRSVRRILIVVLIANLAVTVVKISLGLFTGALAVVADGFHSLVDSSSNLIGLAAIRFAQRPPDEKHPYGYNRYETIGSMAIGFLLLLAAYEIGSAVIERFSSGATPELSALTLGLIALTFPVNLLIVILETRAGRRLNSQILIADATHTRTDLFITGTVLVSLLAVYLGWTWLDPLVAAVVVVLILRAAFGILRDTMHWLADASALNPDEIERLAMEVPGVWYVHRVRSRGSPAAIYVDLHVKVYPGMSTDQAHALATEVENRIQAFYPETAGVLVHIEPGRIDQLQPGSDQAELEYQRLSYDLRQIADGLGLGVHDLRVNREASGELDIEAHLEFKGDTTLDEAHDQAESYESRVRQEWPEISSIITHLEPLPESVNTPAADGNAELLARIRSYLLERYREEQLIEVHSHHLDGHDSVAIRLGLPAETSLVAAHQQAEDLERALLTHFANLKRVIVHMEPE
jgi:cation diffusion facilitator family transporter